MREVLEFRKLFLISILVVLLFLFGCQQLQVQKTETPAVAESVAEAVQESSEVVSEQQEVIGCEYNSDCEQGLLCINKGCKTLASLYNTDCVNKCSVSAVKVQTSDGEEYDLSLGQGSYTAAGALEWKLMKTPDYCKGENPLVAVNIIKKTTGKVVGEQVLTLHKGDTSEVVTHPTVKSVKFTAMLADVTEKCS